MDASTALTGRLSFESQKTAARAMAWPAAVLVVVIHVLWRDPTYTAQGALCAGVLAALALLAIIYSKPFTLPTLPLLLAHYYMAMGSCIFSPPALRGVWGKIRVSSHALDDAALASLLLPAMAAIPFIAMQRFGWRVGPRLGALLDRGDQYTVYDSLAARVIAVLSIAVNFTLNTATRGESPLGDLTHFGTLFGHPMLSLGLLFWDAEKQRSQAANLVFWGGVGALALSGLSTGMLGAAAQPVLTAAVLVWKVRGRIPTGVLVGGLLAFMALNSTKHIYRSLTWRDGETVSLIERAENWLTAIERTYSGQSSDALSDSAQSTASRLVVFAQVAHILDWVPTKIPHAGAEQWLKLPLEFVPRVLWNDKPVHTEEFNNRYTVTFKLQQRKNTRQTTITLPIIGDGYWRLGWWGIAIEATLLGGLIGFYHGLSAVPSRGLLIIVSGLIMGTPPDQHVFSHLAGQPQHWIFMVFIMILLQAMAAAFRGAKTEKFVWRSRTTTPESP